MKLNTPYWAVIKDGKVKWDYESPFVDENKEFLLEWIQGIIMICSEGQDTYCGLTAEEWEKLEIKQIILKEV